MFHPINLASGAPKFSGSSDVAIAALTTIYCLPLASMNGLGAVTALKYSGDKIAVFVKAAEVEKKVPLWAG
jgi:hypothetical protein